jgi:hypothetical protein
MVFNMKKNVDMRHRCTCLKIGLDTKTNIGKENIPTQYVGSKEKHNNCVVHWLEWECSHGIIFGET